LLLAAAIVVEQIAEQTAGLRESEAARRRERGGEDRKPKKRAGAGAGAGHVDGLMI
jgi:hypothetical protein